jgi:hypothetical protein
MFWWDKSGFTAITKYGRRSPLRKRLLRKDAEGPRRKGETMLILLIILLLVFGFGGYRLGPGLGYYGGGGISLIILIVIILLLLRVIWAALNQKTVILRKNAAWTLPRGTRQQSAENHRWGKQYRIPQLLVRNSSNQLVISFVGLLSVYFAEIRRFVPGVRLLTGRRYS